MKYCTVDEMTSKPSIFIDTGAWVALNEKRDKHHKEAVSFIKSIRKGDLAFGHIHTSDFIIQETYTYLLYNYSYEAAMDIVKRIRDSNIIIHPFDLRFKDVWTRIEENGLSFVDWTSVFYMEKYGISHIFTFDSDFARFGIRIHP